MKRPWIVALGLLAACAGAESGNPAPATSAPVCALDGELPVELSDDDGALALRAAAGDLATDLLGAAATWEGDLRGLVLDAGAHAIGDGELPAIGPDGEMTLVRVGWTTTWCAGDREVELTAGETGANAACRAVTDACGGGFEVPAIDADEALQDGAEASAGAYQVVLYQARPGAVPATLAWQVTWEESDGSTGAQVFRWVDAMTGEILPCGDGADDGCVGP